MGTRPSPPQAATAAADGDGTGGQASSVCNGVRVIWSRPSFNDTKTTLKKVCEICNTNGSSMLKRSGCNCTYYCSRECQKKGWKYHKSACKNLKIDGGFDRDTFTNIKFAINWNIKSPCFKDSIVCTSACKYWKVNFDPDDKDDTYMTLTQSSKEQFLHECYGHPFLTEKDEDNVSIIFYFIVNIQLYSVAAVLS
jgi:hypothetical protein